LTCPARDVAIVGGGIVGASCAYFLAERGADVLLLESGRIGREASGMNAGGVRQQGRALPEIPLALEALALWADLDKRLDADLEYERTGDLRIAETEPDLARVRALADREREAGIALERVEGAGLRSLVPALSARVLGGTFCATGGQDNPLLVAQTFGRRARDLGAKLWDGLPVEISRDGTAMSRDRQWGVRAARLVLSAGVDAALCEGARRAAAHRSSCPRCRQRRHCLGARRGAPRGEPQSSA
jgi:sarcosine oxidase subunit beta